MSLRVSTTISVAFDARRSELALIDVENHYYFRAVRAVCSALRGCRRRRRHDDDMKSLSVSLSLSLCAGQPQDRDRKQSPRNGVFCVGR